MPAASLIFPFESLARSDGNRLTGRLLRFDGWTGQRFRVKVVRLSVKNSRSNDLARLSLTANKNKAIDVGCVSV